MFLNKLLDLPGPKAPNPKDTPESKFVSPLLWGNIEIQATYFTICKVRQFFSRSPRGLVNLKSDYLGFVVHAYLNEIYILEQRMCTYLKTLPRAAAKGSEVRDRLDKVKPELLKAVNHVFNNVRGTRGAHVHQQRFSDDGIDRLRIVELMNHFPRHFPPLESFYRSELRRVRKSWDVRFAANEIAIKTLMDHYYDVILTAIFKPDGSLRSFL